MDILLMFIIIVRIKIQRVHKMQYFVYNNTEEKRVILPSLLPSLNDEIWPTISTPMKTTFVAHHFHWLIISPAPQNGDKDFGVVKIETKERDQANQKWDQANH